MKKTISILRLLAAAILLGPFVSLAAAPRLVVDEPHFEFGAQSNNQTIEHTFVLRNEGDAPLNIERVRSSCGCTVGHISSHHILPGETAEISGRFNLVGRRGSQRSVLTVETNDPQRPHTQLTMSGQAVVGMEFRPAGVFFETATAGQRLQRDIELIGVAGDAFDLSGIKVMSERFEVGDPIQLAPHHYRIPVFFEAGSAEGLVQDMLEVHTSHSAHPRMVASLNAQVVGAVSYSPTEILLPAGIADPVTRHIVVRPGGAGNFEITSAEVPGEQTTTQILRMPGGAYRIQLGQLTASEEVLGQSVRLHTNLETMPVIEIPIIQAAP